MTPLEAELILAEWHKRRIADKEMLDNLWSLYEFTGDVSDRVRISVLHKVMAAAMGGVTINNTFRNHISDAILRHGSHKVAIHGKRHFNKIRERK